MTKPPILPLVALPAAFTVLLFLMRDASLPMWQVFNLDPDYFYLFNSLLIVEGLPPTDLAHPGTPVQVLIAATIRFLHPFTPTTAIIDAVMADPERYLFAASNVIFLMVGAALVVMGRAFYRLTGSLWPALLSQCAPFLSMVIPKFALHAKPEPFLVMAVCLMVAVAAEATRAARPETRHAVWFGVVMGFGAACKLNFLPLGVLPLVMLARPRLIIVYGAATAVAFLVFVAPALPNAHLFFDWMAKIALHSGPYGDGAATIIDFGRFPRTILKVLGSKLLFTVPLVLSLAMLLAHRRLVRQGDGNPRMARLLTAVVTAQLLSVLFVAKQPAPHYTLPMVMLAGPALALLWVLSRPLLSAGGHRGAWATIAIVLAALQIPASWVQYRELAGWTAASMGFDMSRFARCGKVFYDTASAKSYAMERADKYVYGHYADMLDARMPKDEYTWYIYDHVYWKKDLVHWGRTIALTDILSRHDCVVFRGNAPYTLLPTIAGLLPAFTFDDRCDFGEETVLTKGITCTGAPPPPGPSLRPRPAAKIPDRGPAAARPLPTIHGRGDG